MYSMIYVPLIKGVYYRLTTGRELTPTRQTTHQNKEKVIKSEILDSRDVRQF